MENVQARDRSSRVLAALAASFGGVFSCTAN
jgi:NAD+ synthase (glutamine-hydrolysing)